MHITQVNIENIRSIRQAEITFPHPKGWHVLIGDNGSGKTTILRAIALGLIGLDHSNSLRLNLDDYLNFQSTEGSIKINFPNNEFIFNLSLDGMSYLGRRWIIFSASFGPFRRFTGGNREWDKVQELSPEASRHISLFGEDVALTEAIDWLVNLNYKKLEKDKDAEETLNHLIEFINQSELLPQQTKIVEVSSKGVFLEDGNKQKVSIHEMSDGFRSILSMTFEIIRLLVKEYGNGVFMIGENDIYINAEGVILIDEVDTHLHPSWQTRVGHWFTKYFPNMQFIVTTHSPLICRACEKGSIWRLATPNTDMPQIQEIVGTDKERLIYGNILDAYGTEVFGQEAVRSVKSNEKKQRLGKLNILAALGKINDAEEKERRELQKILTTDDPTGFE